MEKEKKKVYLLVVQEYDPSEPDYVWENVYSVHETEDGAKAELEKISVEPSTEFDGELNYYIVETILRK